jgi:arginase
MDIEERKPLVRDEDVVQFGQRDAEEAMQYASQDILATNIHVYDLTVVRKLGIDRAAAQAIEILQRPVLAGFWLHLDVDVLDDAIMPAVDYRIPDGFSFAELRTVLCLALASGRIVGMDVTIFNPRLDIDGSIARKLVTTLVEGQARLPWLPNAD